jgi:hypothetical protein
MKNVFNKQKVLPSSNTVINTNTTTFGNLDNLTDTTITSALQNQYLQYDTGIWKNKTFNENLNSLSDVTVSSPTNRQVLKNNGSQFVNSNISTDDISDMLITSPQPNDLLYFDGSWKNKQFLNDSSSSALETYSSNKINNLIEDNKYFTLISTASTTINPAIKNTHYNLIFGGNIQIEPLNVGDRILVTANTNTTKIDFGGVSFVINAFTAGSISNPTFVLKNAVIELVCSFNTGQTYYLISRVYQGPNSNCTLNGTKISSLDSISDIPNNDIGLLGRVALTTLINKQVLRYDGSNFVNTLLRIDDLDNVLITSPSNNQVLTYSTVGSKWINSTPSSGGVTSFNSRTGVVLPLSGDYNLTNLGDVSISGPINSQILRFNGSVWTNANAPTKTININFNSNAALAASNYLLPVGQTVTEFRGRYYLMGTGTLATIIIYLSAATTASGTRTFDFRLNGTSFFSFTTNNAASTTFPLTGQFTPQIISQNTYFQVFHTTTLTPVASDAIVSLVYTI